MDGKVEQEKKISTSHPPLAIQTAVLLLIQWLIENASAQVTAPVEPKQLPTVTNTEKKPEHG